MAVFAPGMYGIIAILFSTINPPFFQYIIFLVTDKYRIAEYLQYSLWENLYLSAHHKMVVGNNVVRIGRNGTIHKLIVIRIDCNQIKVIEWSYQFNKRTVQYGFHHIFRRFIVGKSLQNFYIFLQYFIGYTELVLSVHKGLPQDMVTTPLRNALNKTIRTKNQLAIDVILMNGYPFQLFHPAFSGQEFPYPKVHPTLYSSVWNNIERAPLSILPDLPEIYRKKTFPTNASVWG